MRTYFLLKNRIAQFFAVFGIFAIDVVAQTAVRQEIIEGAHVGWWFAVVMIVVAGLGGAVYFWIKSKKSENQPQYNYDNRYSNHYRNESYDIEGEEAQFALERLRKARKSTPNPADKSRGTKKPRLSRLKTPLPEETADGFEDLSFDTKIFQQKMRKLQYSQLPINSFDELSAAKLYNPLQLSNDESLICAIEQANEEFEEDETVRDLAVRILAAFKTRNSVEALSQIALYDLSSNLRSKAVSALTDFDHESVFESILLACADPTREVRAAAARGLFRLNFDRADAWNRIIETNDEFRMSHAARAAVESGIVVNSFVRLVHDDLKVAYESFVLVTLLIRSGETNEIFQAINSHKDERVRFALLHVLKVNKDERTLAALVAIQRDRAFPTDVALRIRETINSFEEVPA